MDLKSRIIGTTLMFTLTTDDKSRTNPPLATLENLRALVDRKHVEVFDLQQALLAARGAAVHTEVIAVQAKISVAISDIDELVDMVGAVTSSTISHDAKGITLAAQMVVDAALAPFGESGMNIDASLATNLATQRLRLAEVQQRHETAHADADVISKRITASELRRDAMTASRLHGTVTSGEAAEYVALGGDLDVLRTMYAQAKAAAVKLDPVFQRQQVDQADKDLREHIAVATFQALTERTREAERSLLTSLHATYAVGRGLGKRTVGDAFTFSAALRSAIVHNHLPEA